MNWSVRAELACFKNALFINIKIKMSETAGLQNIKNLKLTDLKHFLSTTKI